MAIHLLADEILEKAKACRAPFATCEMVALPQGTENISSAVEQTVIESLAEKSIRCAPEVAKYVESLSKSFSSLDEEKQIGFWRSISTDAKNNGITFEYNHLVEMGGLQGTRLAAAKENATGALMSSCMRQR